MRVRFIGPPPSQPSGKRPDHAFLSVGTEYVVASVSARGSEGVQFLVLDDELQEPAWFSASLFDLVSSDVPSNWVIRLGGGGAVDRIEIGPAAWFEPDFFEDYWSDGGIAAIAAQETFRREWEVIVRES